ncbi:SURF1 family cytochrome oxidase biogenesis protein [Sanguibacter suarezii]|uniref:SURF1 family cytochrome oxidase biogenesis protein n=1 Tax=Sanguibacter suarezii TaxID=60921 RepID=UPI001FE05B51|nr:SURF1 family cytochrome oxidase biogenesis protein [Sanguibacter suarezii]
MSGAVTETSSAPSTPTPPGSPSPAPGGRTRAQWLALALGVAVLVVGCVLAGRWQWNRHVDRDAAIAVITENYSATPVPLAQILPEPGAVVTEKDVWRQVTLRGHYVPEATVLLRNRPVESQAAFHVLVPFEAEDGTVLVINRGWLRYGRVSAEPDSVPAPPAGEVEVVVRLRADEPAATNGAPDGQVQAINTAQVLAAGPDGGAWAQGRTVGAYGALASETPAPAQAVAPLPAPDTDPRSHLSYAFQWWVFAVGGVGGFVLLVVRERRENTLAALGGLAHPFDDAETGPDGHGTAGGTGGTAGTGAAGSRAAGRRGRGQPTAEEIEDSLIESRTGR